MSDYISRDVAIIEFIDNDLDHIQAPNGKEVVQILSDIPAADVAPVVRCRDCRKRRKDGYCTKFIQNISGGDSAWYMPQDDDFCSYGERKE